MNQTMTADYTQVIPLALAAGQFPSLCTIQDVPGTLNAIGAPVTTFTNVSGLVDIPCKNAPPSNASIIGSDELRLADRTDEKQERHVLLSGYYPQIQMKMRAVIDGAPFNIIGVQSDSMSTQTRLQVQDYDV
jgi:hypothetical protein